MPSLPGRNHGGAAFCGRPPPSAEVPSGRQSSLEILIQLTWQKRGRGWATLSPNIGIGKRPVPRRRDHGRDGAASGEGGAAEPGENGFGGEDPCGDTINQVHSHHGLLSVLVGAFACGRLTLREVGRLLQRRKMGPAAGGVGGRGVGQHVLPVAVEARGGGVSGDAVEPDSRPGAARAAGARAVSVAVVLAADGKLQWRSTGPGVEGARVVVDDRNSVDYQQPDVIEDGVGELVLSRPRLAIR